MTRLFMTGNTLVAIVLFVMAPTILVDGFAPPVVGTTTTTTTTTTKTSLCARGKSSPLLGEALEAYPFSFEGKRAMVSEQKATVAFNELARLYGDDEALAIVELFPRSLCFDSTNYAPCLEAWTEQFGLEASQGMVGRNPGLLGVKPFTAKEPAEASMFFSYIIAVTRPLPKIIAVGLILSIVTAGLG